MKTYFLILMAWLIFSNVAFAFDQIELHDEKSRAGYWTSKNPSGENILLTNAEILEINASMIQHDLKSYPDKISVDAVREKILQCPNKFSEVDSIPNNCDFEQITGEVLFAVTSEQAELRSIPDSAAKFQTIDPLIAVVVLAESIDCRFYFVESKDFAGWIDAGKVSFTDRATWLKFYEPENFLVVTSNKKFVPIGTSFGVWLRMGSKIPLESLQKRSGRYRALVVFDVNQHLNEIPVSISDDESVSLGFLDCTENNLIRQAFKYLGDDEVDSYELTSNIYRTVGIELPRNYRQEKLMPVQINLTGAEEYDRLQRIFFARPGAIIYEPGHAMMYIGRDLNSPIVIHALDKYFTFDSGVREENFVNRVIMSKLDFFNQHEINALHFSTSIGELIK